MCYCLDDVYVIYVKVVMVSVQPYCIVRTEAIGLCVADWLFI